MQIPKKFIHDRIVLLLLSVNAFVAVMCSVLVLLQLDPSRQTSFIVEYRANRGLNAFKAGGMSVFISFILFVLFVCIFNSFLSAKVYHIRRYFAVSVLAMTTVTLILATVVSYALLRTQ